MVTYKVRTQDVDGRTAKKYKTLDGAVKRFLEMAGGTIEGWIGEQFYELVDKGEPLPKIEDIKRLRAVSDYGTVVVLEVVA